jgi:hypothetical protein
LKYHRIDEGIFFRIRRLAWYIDPESYAGGSVATCRATLADRSKESTQTKRDKLVLQVGGWVVGPAPHHPVKTHMLKKPRQRLGKTDGLSNKRHEARKVNELRYMECSRRSRKNGRNNVRSR